MVKLTYTNQSECNPCSFFCFGFPAVKQMVSSYLPHWVPVKLNTLKDCKTLRYCEKGGYINVIQLYKLLQMNCTFVTVTFCNVLVVYSCYQWLQKLDVISDEEFQSYFLSSVKNLVLVMQTACRSHWLYPQLQALNASKHRVRFSEELHHFFTIASPSLTFPGSTVIYSYHLTQSLLIPFGK